MREATAAYVALARAAGLSPAALALRFVLDHPLVASAVTGATSSRQLDELLDAAEVAARGRLPAELREAVDAVHARYPSPCV